jgi:hypothetical protein
MLWLIVKSRQFTDVQPCINHANMTLVAVPGVESPSVTRHDWKTLLRSSASNMLTRPPYDVPRANFADNHSITIDSCGLDSRQWPPRLRRSMNAKQALAWVRKSGIAVESARASVPSLAQVVAGEPLRGSWWAHPKRNEIFLLSRAIRRSPDVLVCRLVDGKITYIHRRLWSALVRSAGRFSKHRLAAVKEVHTSAGKHKLLVTPFPKWVPNEVLRAAEKLSEKEAASQLAFLL